jgi:hypothetical protein
LNIGHPRFVGLDYEMAADEIAGGMDSVVAASSLARLCCGLTRALQAARISRDTASGESDD